MDSYRKPSGSRVYPVETLLDMEQSTAKPSRRELRFNENAPLRAHKNGPKLDGAEVLSDEESVLGGVPIVPQSFHNPVHYGSGQPTRQPYGPPAGEGLQKFEGFARFLKEHTSPRHKRVTAGGKIVPAGPNSPPPTFREDFLDRVIEQSEASKGSQGNPRTNEWAFKVSAIDDSFESAGIGTTTDDSGKPPSLSHAQETENSSSSSGSSGKNSTLVPQSAESFDEGANVDKTLLNLPPGFTPVHVFEGGQQAIVSIGTSVMKAYLNDKGVTAFETLHPVTPQHAQLYQEQNGASTFMPMASNPGYEPVLSSGIPSFSQSVQMQTMPYMAHYFHSEPTGPYQGMQTYTTDLSSGPYPSMVTVMVNGQLASIQVPQPPLFNGILDGISPFSEGSPGLTLLNAELVRLKKELREVERHLALNDPTLPFSEREKYNIAKKRLIEGLGILRKRKEGIQTSIESSTAMLQTMPSLINGAPASSMASMALVPMGAGYVPPGRLLATQPHNQQEKPGGNGSKTKFSASAREFVPQGMTPTPFAGPSCGAQAASQTASGYNQGEYLRSEFSEEKFHRIWDGENARSADEKTTMALNGEEGGHGFVERPVLATSSTQNVGEKAQGLSHEMAIELWDSEDVKDAAKRAANEQVENLKDGQSNALGIHGTETAEVARRSKQGSMSLLRGLMSRKGASQNTVQSAAAEARLIAGPHHLDKAHAKPSMSKKLTHENSPFQYFATSQAQSSANHYKSQSSPASSTFHAAEATITSPTLATSEARLTNIRGGTEFGSQKNHRHNSKMRFNRVKDPQPYSVEMLMADAQRSEHQYDRSTNYRAMPDFVQSEYSEHAPYVQPATGSSVNGLSAGGHQKQMPLLKLQPGQMPDRAPIEKFQPYARSPVPVSSVPYFSASQAPAQKQNQGHRAQMSYQNGPIGPNPGQAVRPSHTMRDHFIDGKSLRDATVRSGNVPEGIPVMASSQSRVAVHDFVPTVTMGEQSVTRNHYMGTSFVPTAYNHAQSGQSYGSMGYHTAMVPHISSQRHHALMHYNMGPAVAYGPRFPPGHASSGFVRPERESHRRRVCDNPNSKKFQHFSPVHSHRL